MKTRVALHLDTLSCGAENEHGSEPYIWPIMITDEGGIPRVHTPTEEWAAKVLTSEMRAGQSVPIPAGMDLSLVEVFDDKAAALAVMIVILFEKDSTPHHGSVAVLHRVEEISLDFVQQHLAECRQSSGNRGDLRNMLATGITQGVTAKEGLSYYERITTWASSGGFDDSIGLDLWTFSAQGLATRNFSFSLDSLSERFSLTATLQVSNLPTPLCQAQRDEVERAEAVVKSIQTQRELLQTQLHHATPQQKSGIIAQIKRLAEVDEPAAEAALAQAKAALAACLDRFGAGTHSPVEPAVFG
jgi:hypothetical protein